MTKRMIIFWLTLFILFTMLTSCSNSVNQYANAPYDVFAEYIEKASAVSWMDGFAVAAQSAILENGKSLLQSKLFYTITGVNKISYAYGDSENTAEYAIQHKNGLITKSYSIYVTSNISEISLPANIKYSDSFEGTLDALELTDKVRNREDERYFSIKNDGETSEIGVSFLSFHTVPVDTDFKTAHATVYIEENNKKADENGREHRYFQRIRLIFREGKLKNIGISVSDEYEAQDEHEIKNNRVGIRFSDPEYKGDDIKIRLEEVYYEDGKISTVYSIETKTETEISITYSGWQSADNCILHERVTHTVNMNSRLTDSIDEPFGKSLYEDYLYFEIKSYYLDFDIEFLYGNLYIYRNSSR